MAKYKTPRAVLLPTKHYVQDELVKICEGSHFIYPREKDLSRVFLTAFSEMAYVANRFLDCHADVLANGTPDLRVYLDQPNSVQGATGYLAELHVYELSTNFKLLPVLAKAAIDKVVPLFDYRFNENLTKFSDRGAMLLERIKASKKIAKKDEFIRLVQTAKAGWLDALIDLRDEYAHYSAIDEYIGFWIDASSIGKRKFHGISDFNPPRIALNDGDVDAADFVGSTKANLLKFFRAFLVLCDYSEFHRPPATTKCHDCKFVFAKREKKGALRGKLKLQAEFPAFVIKEEQAWAGILCPGCGRVVATDLQFWREEGAIFRNNGIDMP